MLVSINKVSVIVTEHSRKGCKYKLEHHSVICNVGEYWVSDVNYEQIRNKLLEIQVKTSHRVIINVS